MYKYQKEILNEIIIALRNIEKITNEKYEIFIGYEKNTNTSLPHVQGYNLYGVINGTNYLKYYPIIRNEEFVDDGGTYISSIKYIDNIKLSNDIFLSLNKLIIEIYENKKQMDNKHNRLYNQALKLNEELKKIV